MKKLTTLASVMLAVASVSASPFRATTVIDGKFAADTEWYLMQVKGAYCHASAPDTPISIDNNLSFDDSDYWCLVGSDTEGYTIYNKAYGTAMMLAAPSNPAAETYAPTGQTAYAEVMAPGKSGYSYTWSLAQSTHVDGAYYVNIKGNASAVLNNRDGKLAFWTTGKDAGSSITFVGTELAGSVVNNVWTLGENVTISCPNGSTASMKDGIVSLGTGVWEFSLPEDKTLDVCAITTTGGEKIILDGYPYVGNVPTIQGPIEIQGLSYLLTDKAEVTPHGYAVFRMDTRHPKYKIVYRIPAIGCIETGEHAGRLIAVNDYRHCGGDIGAGRIDLHISISDDNGLTWSKPDDMRNAQGVPVARGTGAPGNVITNLDCGFGDPAIVTDRETGEVFVIACCGRMNFFSSRRDNPQPSARWWSKDGGKTWTEPDYGQWEQIYALFDDNCPNGYIDGQFIGSGRMVQSKYVKVGDYYRIYAVMSGRHAESGNISNWVLYSDDFGHNWHILGDPYNPAVSSGADEPKCEELPDGSVLLAARGNGGNRNFNIFRYTDIAKAEGRWGQHINTNMGMGGINACNGEILLVPVKNVETGDCHYLALQSFPYGGGRNNVSIAWKALVNPQDYDEPSDFTTWGGRYQVSDMPSAYSTMILQKDNKIGFIFEECTFNGNGYTEMYYPLSIETITNGKYEYFSDEDHEIANKMAKDMMDYRLKALLDNAGGEHVGCLLEPSFPDAEQAIAAFESTPSIEGIAAFNLAIASGVAGAQVKAEVGKYYHFRSAHDGAYSYTSDRFLTVIKSNKKISTGTKANETTTLFRIDEAEDGGFLIYNPNAEAYLPVTSDRTETEMKAVTDKAAAGTFNFQSDFTGHTAIICSNPGHASYPAFHLKSAGGTVVIWTSGAAGSQWYMTPYDYQADSAIEEVTVDVEEQLYDLQGRKISAPCRGSVYVTSQNRKIVY